MWNIPFFRCHSWFLSTAAFFASSIRVKQGELSFVDSRNSRKSLLSQLGISVARPICIRFAAVKAFPILHHRRSCRRQPSPSMSSSSANDAEALRRNRILSSKLYFDVSPSKVSELRALALFAGRLFTS